MKIVHKNESFSRNGKLSRKEIFSRNEPWSRISSNLRTPDHPERISGSKKNPGGEKKTVRNHVFRQCFEVFEAQERSRNDPGRFWEK